MTRNRNPHHDKLLDYKHTRRTSEGGEGWQKARVRLPRRERRLYRQAQERALRQAMLDLDEPGSNAGGEVRGLKRSYFKELFWRREIPLGKLVAYKQSGGRRLMYRLPAGRKMGRNRLPPDNLLEDWAKREKEEQR